VPEPPSKSRVDKAGHRLREWWLNPGAKLTDVLREDVDAIWRYRAQFNYPMTKVNANLRHYVRSVGGPVVIAQRLKRLPRIVEKLTRHPKMRLSQMQDVGGCRAVLLDQLGVDLVLKGIRRNWDIITIDDYVEAPKATGYRAIHAIVRRDDVPVEVQLRTLGQQDWADEIERIDGQVPYAFKDGEGPAEFLRYALLLADVIADDEEGRPRDSSKLEELTSLRQAVP
jgi:ppGpp synthetase/RelA/SpoT-type nucleotidyltranferase